MTPIVGAIRQCIVRNIDLNNPWGWRCTACEGVGSTMTEINHRKGCIVPAALRELDDMVDAIAATTRDVEECRGIIETYGVAEAHPDPKRRVLQLIFTLDAWVAKTGGFGMFSASIERCRREWDSAVAAATRK